MSTFTKPDGGTVGHLPETIEHFLISDETLFNWHEKGYIKAYRPTGGGPLLYDWAEIEQALLDNPGRMRDGRKRGPRGKVLPIQLPKVARAEAVES